MAADVVEKKKKKKKCGLDLGGFARRNLRDDRSAWREIECLDAVR